VILPIPDELAAVLSSDRDTRVRFERLAPSHQREYVTWIGEARKPETRKRRAERVAAMLRVD
jgi:uncharacterized protein YdeI (YjbR/CyaY-like superfamily)